MHKPETPSPSSHRWADGLRSVVVSWRPVHYAILLLVHIHLLSSGDRSGPYDWYRYIYPWADALRLTIVKYHQFPWWNAWSFSGQPFLAEPQTAVLMPDTLFIVGFGAVFGYKLIILFYAFVGYEGSRFLCRQLFGRRIVRRRAQRHSRLVAGARAAPGRWPRRAADFLAFPVASGAGVDVAPERPRAVGLGVVVGCFFLSYVHYVIIIGFSIVGPIVLLHLIRHCRSRQTWLLAALVVCTALGIGLTRLVLVGNLIAAFPRAELSHYPIVATLSDVIAATDQSAANALPSVGRRRSALVGGWQLRGRRRAAACLRGIPGG